MDLKISVKGLGPISEGEVDLMGFTLLAGRNSTGKTLVSKAVYSALKGASSNHSWNLIGEKVEILYKFLSRLHRKNETAPPVLEELRNLVDTPSQFLSFLDKDGSDYAQQVRDIAADIDDIYNRKNREKTIKDLEEQDIFANPQREVNKIESAIEEIKQFAKLSAKDIVKNAVGKKVHQAFQDNFRTGKLSSLAMRSNKGFRIAINDYMTITSFQEDFIVRWENSSELEDIPSLFYIDGAEHNINGQLIRNFSNIRSRYRMIPEIPAYHTDLLNTIEAITLLPEEHLEGVISNIAKSIGGKLEYDNGSLHFHEDGVGIHDASATSSGILQLGLLGLVIEKGLLREGSFLFIDEPETNLHPAWQTLMSGLLAELAGKGKINIVMATHSPYVVQYLKYKAKKDDKFNDILSVNHFADKGINVDIKEELSNDDRLEQIEEDLDERFMDIFIRGELNV